LVKAFFYALPTRVNQSGCTDVSTLDPAAVSKKLVTHHSSDYPAKMARACRSWGGAANPQGLLARLRGSVQHDFTKRRRKIIETPSIVYRPPAMTSFSRVLCFSFFAEARKTTEATNTRIANGFCN